jgi:tetratricopeptide (TPR) repeat protein
LGDAAVLTSQRIRLQQILREAEGYLELAMLFSDDFDTSVARRLAIPLALATLDRMGEAGSMRSHALYLKGESLRALERYQEAIAPLKAAADLDPGNIHVWLALGWCYKRCGHLDLAIDALDRALEAGDGNGIVFYNLACYWSLAHNKDRALECLSQAFAINPDYRDMVDREPDFNPLRTDPDFQALTSMTV